MLYSALPFIAFSLLHVFGEVINSRWIRVLSKPLLMPLLALFYIVMSPSPSVLLLAAIAGGWLGDLFLMVPDRGESRLWFKSGLVAFLLGHLFYAAAFFRESLSGHLTVIAILFSAVFAVYGVVVFLKMKSYLGKLLIPVAVYIAVIMVMGISTALCFGSEAAVPAGIAVLGALIFMISDTMNSWNRFVKVIPHERVLTMSTYLTGQFLLVLGYLLFTL